MAKGSLLPAGTALDPDAIVRAAERIAADAELSQRFDALGEEELREAILAIYAEELERGNGG